jgi:hypothetical protein
VILDFGREISGRGETLVSPGSRRTAVTDCHRPGEPVGETRPPSGSEHTTNRPRCHGELGVRVRAAEGEGGRQEGGGSTSRTTSAKRRSPAPVGELLARHPAQALRSWTAGRTCRSTRWRSGGWRCRTAPNPACRIPKGSISPWRPRDRSRHGDRVEPRGVAALEGRLLFRVRERPKAP